MEFERVRIEQFFRTYGIASFAVSKDESQIAFSTNLSGKFDVWSMTADAPYPAPLTSQGQLPHDIQFSPNHDYILVSFDHDGDENAQLYAVSPNGGNLRPLRTAPSRRFMSTHISKDGNRLFYSSDKDNHSFLNGYVYDLETETEAVLYEGVDGPTEIIAVSEDELSFVTVRAYANTFVVAHVHKNGSVLSVTPDDTVPHVAFDVKFYGDDSLLLATDFGEDRMYLALRNLETGEFRKLYGQRDADVTGFKVDKNANVAYLHVSGSVEDQIIAFDLGKEEATVLDTPFTAISQMHVADSGTLYALAQSDTKPSNLFKRGVNGDFEQITSNRIMGVTQDELSPAQTITYRSFDGLEIEALLFKANEATKNGYTVIWPHGGPQASERRFYRSFFQYLTYIGYQVFAPNFRGSFGYGSDFIKMVEGDWGHGPRLDMVEGIEWLIGSGHAERDKLFLVGGSYGGYMTLLLHGRHADYFQACVDIFGPCNLFTFLESVPDHWKPMMKQWLGDPSVDKERLTADSPITYLSGMTKPMLVIQGANDPRVVKAESDQIVEALRAQGTDVEYIVFDDEGHGFSKKENEIKAYGSSIEFLEKHRTGVDTSCIEVATGI